MILSLADVSAGYGSTPVLRDIRFSQAGGEVLGIIGHNGMGKTTLLRTLAGLLKTGTGSITFDGQRIDALPAYRRSALGIGYVAQGDRGFPGLTVAESLKLATLAKGRTVSMTIDRVIDLFPGLANLLARRSETLSGGERQLLAIARAVIRTPQFLLLDELTEGVQPSIVENLAERLRSLHSELKMTMLIVDQELAFVASLATRILVMQKGRLVRELGADALADPDVLGGFGG